MEFLSIRDRYLDMLLADYKTERFNAEVEQRKQRKQRD